MRLKLKTLTVSLFALGLSTSIFAKPVLVKSYNQIEEYKLDNGLKIILSENNKDNKVFMNMIYQTGSLNDPKGKGGLAHLLEHLAFKGTENIKGEKFQSLLEQYTLSNNASTDYYVTQYTNEIRPEQKSINEVLRLEAERMDKLVLQKKFVPSEIEIVKRERELTSDQPFALLIDNVFKAIYGNQNLGREPIGDLDELQSINMDELNQFYKAWYAPNNAVLVMTGKFDKAAVLKQLDQLFSAIPQRQVPEQAVVPKLDISKIKDQKFNIQKGSSYQKMNIYITPRNSKIEPTLDVAPLLFTMEPSGHLYQNIVDTGIVDDVDVSPWTSRDFNMLIVAADYVPSQNVEKIEKALISGVEQSKPFSDKELKRVQNLFKNSNDADFKDAVKIGEVLSESVALNKGDWIQYFNNKNAIQNLKVDDVNKEIKTFFGANNRLNTEITPTSEAEKKAMTLSGNNVSQSLNVHTDAKPEPLKNVAVYKKEVAEYLQNAKQILQNANKKIIKGKLENGLQYALYPTTTIDDQNYASVVVNFGTEKTLFNQGEIIDFTSYLMMRGSNQYSLQDIADRSIEADGDVMVVANKNVIEFKITADKEKFEDYFKFILDVIKTPIFDKQQFDLIKTKSLNRLDRSYTEPEIVASLALNKIINPYSVGDLRYFSEPESTKKFINQTSNEKVKQFYGKYIGMNNAQVAVTGEFDVKRIKDILNTKLSAWNSQETYEPIDVEYHPIKAQKHHLLAEQREFGSYKADLALPLGADNADLPAMTVLSYLLGESQLSSRLGQELREKNALVYGFNQSLTLSEYKNAGSLNISANYTAGKSDLVSQAVHKVLKDLLDKGVTEQEVEAAKADLLKQGASGLENELTIQEFLVPQLKRNRDLSYTINKYEKISKISKKDVDSVIKKYIKLDQLVEVMADQYGKDVK